MTLEPLDQLWLLACSGLVLLMQAGFMCLESGLTRSKNAVSVSLKNLVDLAIAPLLFWGFGASLMFGVSWCGLIGTPGLTSGTLTPSLVVFLIFQTLFCATAATIVSGAIAERMRFTAYVLVCVLLTALVYPLVGHWVWGGAWTGVPGWLEAMGFADFAGSSVVHMTGGFASLAAVLAIGPRLGRFDSGAAETDFAKNSLPMATLGTLLLVVGWIGFNGGSTLAFDGAVPGVVLNTLLAAAAGGAGALVAAHLRSHTLNPEWVINGVLGGLVAICAGANVASPAGAIGLGALAGLATVVSSLTLLRLKIDDVVGAFPVHGVCGVLGVLSVPLLKGVAGPDLLPALGVQALGAASVGVAAFLPVFLLVAGVLTPSQRRVSDDDEAIGLNRAEHGAESELEAVIRGIARWNDDTGHGTNSAIDAHRDAADAATLAERLDVGLRSAFRKGQLATLSDAERLRTEELKAYGGFLHAVLDSVDTQVCILDAAGRIVETNDAWDRFLSASDMVDEGGIGRSFPEFCVGSGVYERGEAESLGAQAYAVAAGESQAVQIECAAVVGVSERLMKVTIKPLPATDRGAALVLQQDLTDERSAQQLLRTEKQKAETLADALEASQQSLELAVKGGNLGLWHWDVTSGYFELNHAWLERVGYDGAALNADVEEFRDLLHSDERVLWTEADAASLAGDEPYDRQFRVRRPDGSYTWVQALGRSNATRADGSPESLSGILIDINDRKHAELRDAGMAQIIEEAFNEIFVIDRQTRRFLEVNRGARENLGYTLDELREMTPADVKESQEEVDRILGPLAAGETDRVMVETKHRRADGSSYACMLCVQPGRLMDRDVFVAIGTDLTQRHELEAQLAQAQRLESIGQLAAGVAHEMNTPLQFVSSNVKFLNDCSDSLFEVIGAYEHNLSEDTAPRPWRDRHAELQELVERNRFDRIRREMPKAIDESLEGIDRVLQIVRAMKEFSHPGENEKAPTDLNQAIASTATITRNRWKTSAELVLDLDPGLPHVECVQAEINQVFVNLIVNASDAINERRATDPDAPSGWIRITSRLESDQAVFEVADNGCGMSDDTLRRVFDPFFTTKEVGQGTGQGLSLSHTIVAQKHGGSISATSKPGDGATIRVTLPLKASGLASALPGDATDAIPDEPINAAALPR